MVGSYWVCHWKKTFWVGGCDGIGGLAYLLFCAAYWSRLPRVFRRLSRSCLNQRSPSSDHTHTYSADVNLWTVVHRFMDGALAVKEKCLFFRFFTLNRVPSRGSFLVLNMDPHLIWPWVWWTHFIKPLPSGVLMLSECQYICADQNVYPERSFIYEAPSINRLTGGIQMSHNFYSIDKKVTSCTDNLFQDRYLKNSKEVIYLKIIWYLYGPYVNMIWNLVFFTVSWYLYGSKFLAWSAHCHIKTLGWDVGKYSR